MRELSLNNCRLDKRYDVQRGLGRGSYAEIFVARDTMASPQSPHSLVVIKALNVFLQNDLDPDLERTLVENFQNEAIALDRVRHPNIISRLGHGSARDLEGMMFHYLVLEYMAGGDLQKIVREKSLNPKRALEYIEQVCAGLRHAHRHNVIHRDIKPQNLLLTNDRSTVKIADFGVARIHLSDSPITRVGTNVYAPPEHSPMITGEGVMTVAALTPAADIYSLAKSAYTLLTGETPRFYANQPITDLPITVRGEEWASELKRVLAKATAREPGERHQNIEEFWADLEPVRKMILQYETATTVRPKLHDTPQAHVARGYTPLAPQRPRFDTSRDLKLKDHIRSPDGQVRIDIAAPQPRYPAIQPAKRPEDIWPENDPNNGAIHITNDTNIEIPAPEPKRSGKFRRRITSFVVLLAIFVGGLYGTSVYLRSLGILPAIESPFAAQTGRTNTDINLRPEPNIRNEPIGVVTKNSRVRIVKTENNWYQVEVLEQGRDRNPPLPTNRGWLSGRYVELE